MATTKAVIDDGQYTDDIVSVGSAKFALYQGFPITIQSVAEFSTGLKTGPLTYDHREHAFWNVFNDFSGGFGYRHVDSQDDVGRHWDNPGGVDLRRKLHVTLPPKHLTVTPDHDASLAGVLYFVQHSLAVSTVGGTPYLQVGIGDTLYTLDQTRTAFTRRQIVSGAPGITRLNRILEFRGSDGVAALYAFGYGADGHGYWRSTDGVAWTKYAGAGAGAAFGHDITDAIVWDTKIIAMKTDSGYGIISSADGLTWSTEIDAPMPADDEAAEAAAGTESAEEEAREALISAALGVHWRPGGLVTFVGVAMAPTGKNSVYFIDQGTLWALDFDVYNAIKIQDLGEQLYLSDGTVWNGSVFVTNGTAIWQFKVASGEAVQFLGPFGKDGAPPTWLNGAYNVVQFLTGTSYLFAVCRDQVTFTKTRLLVFTQTGWSWFGEEFGDATHISCPYAGLIDRFPVDLSLTVPSRAIDIVCGTQSNANPLIKLHTFQLPVASEIPYVGSGAAFAPGPAPFETGWFDGGFVDLEGALIRFQVDGHNITDTETVLVEYRLNNDESMNYQKLGVFNRRLQQIWFSEDHRGIAFKTVQFRITLEDRLDAGTASAGGAATLTDATKTWATNTYFAKTVVITGGTGVGQSRIIASNTGSVLTVTAAWDTNPDNTSVYKIYDQTLTPELRSLVLVFDKKPNFRASWTVRVDLHRTVQKSFYKSIPEVLDAIEGLFNVKTLLPFSLPNVIQRDVSVRISELQGSLEAVRKEASERGTVDLTFLEIVT